MTGALGRGIHIPPMRLVEWPLQLVESPHFLKYVLEHVSAEDAALGWQDSDGCTVTMRIVDMRNRSSLYIEVHRLWLEKWSPSECCSTCRTRMVALWPCTSLDMGSPMCRGCG